MSNKDHFPCIDCITFPICKCYLIDSLKKFKYLPTVSYDHNSCSTFASIDSLTLYFATIPQMNNKCAIFKRYVDRQNNKKKDTVFAARVDIAKKVNEVFSLYNPKDIV